MWDKLRQFGSPTFVQHISPEDPYPVVLIGETQLEGEEEILSWGYTHLGDLVVLRLRTTSTGYEEVPEALISQRYAYALREFRRPHTAFLAGAIMWENAPEHRTQIMAIQRFNH